MTSSEETNMVNERVSGVDQVCGTKSGVEYRTIDYYSLKKSYYRGEGNTTLVLALPDEGKVLRLRKSDAKNGDEKAAAPEDDGNDNGEARARLAVDFHRKVIALLLGRFATEPEIVRCNWKDLSARLNELESERPVSRRHKMVTETIATVLPDYAQLHDDPLEIVPSKSPERNICIEMKVKALTRYCGKPLHSETACPSCYRTSGGTNCLRNVLHSLAHEAKSLKIFKDGHLLAQKGVTRTKPIIEIWFDHNESLLPPDHQSMKDLAGAALEHPFPATLVSTEDPHRPSDHSERPRESLIDVIARIERDMHREVDTIYPIYTKYSSILTDRMVYTWDENEPTPAGMPSMKELQMLRDYLVYRIIRDSSILVTYRSIEWREKDFPNEQSFVIDKNPGRADTVTYAVNITDLEPKSVHCIEKHYRKYIAKRNKIRS